MKDETNKMIIEMVIRTLERITVCGKENMDMLLGSIIALEQILSEPTNKENEVDEQRIDRSENNG